MDDQDSHPPHAGPEPQDSEGTESSEGSDGQQTHGTSKRWWLTNDLLAFALLLSLDALVFFSGLRWIDVETIPEMAVYGLTVGFGVAIVWAFGKDAVEAWRGGK